MKIDVSIQVTQDDGSVKYMRESSVHWEVIMAHIFEFMERCRQ